MRGWMESKAAPPVVGIGFVVLLVIALVWGASVYRDSRVPEDGVNVGWGDTAKLVVVDGVRCVVINGARSVAVSCDWGSR